jgi:hypothetical protein
MAERQSVEKFFSFIKSIFISMHYMFAVQAAICDMCTKLCTKLCTIILYRLYEKVTCYAVGAIRPRHSRQPCHKR